MKSLNLAIRMGSRFWVEQEGPTVTEYGVLLVLIVLGTFAVVILIGEFAKDAYTTLTVGLPEGQ